jgi:hypothetical protein
MQEISKARNIVVDMELPTHHFESTTHFAFLVSYVLFRDYARHHQSFMVVNVYDLALNYAHSQIFDEDYLIVANNQAYTMMPNPLSEDSQKEISEKIQQLLNKFKVLQEKIK